MSIKLLYSSFEPRFYSWYTWFYRVYPKVKFVVDLLIILKIFICSLVPSFNLLNW